MTPTQPTPSRPRARGGRRRGGTGRRRAGGFTLVEILVAIGIVVVLLGIVLVGAGKITGQSKENATRVALDNLRSMVAEYESKGGLGGLNPPYAITDTVVAPRSVTEEGYVATDANLNHRYKSDAVTNTVELMQKLLALTPNKNAFSRIPPASVMKDDPATGTINEGQVLLDAWGNPIIFVPGGGMSGVVLAGQLQAQPIKSRDNRPYWASAGPDGTFSFLDANNNGSFDSGDGSGGDDNLYSFEN